MHISSSPTPPTSRTALDRVTAATWPRTKAIIGFAPAAASAASRRAWAPPRQMWVMASARASAASAGLGAASSRRMRVTMRPTWALSARPLPETAAFTSLGVCSATGSPRRAAAHIAIPLAWAVPMIVLTSERAKTRSTATASGRCSRATPRSRARWPPDAPAPTGSTRCGSRRRRPASADGRPRPRPRRPRSGSGRGRSRARAWKPSRQSSERVFVRTLTAYADGSATTRRLTRPRLSGCRARCLAPSELRWSASREGVGCGTPTTGEVSVASRRRRARPSRQSVAAGSRGRPWSGRRRTARRLRGCCIRRCGPGTPGVPLASG